MNRKQRKREKQEASRLRRARLLAGIDPFDPSTEPPYGAVAADPEALRHNNTYGSLPRFYVDRVITCRDCGAEEVWPAHRQKWWYEVAKGNIHTDAVWCRACRRKRAEKKKAARDVHLSGLAAKRDIDAS